METQALNFVMDFMKLNEQIFIVLWYYVETILVSLFFFAYS